MEVAGTQPEDTMRPVKYPKAVFFILGNELCERYSYYGLKIILSLYLKNSLHYLEEDAIMIVHAFGFLSYNLPILGGILADSYIGKYKTIVYSSVIHVAGNVIITLSATPWAFSPRAFALVGLLLTALGVGLLKPCVNPFGGEQFVLPQQAKELARFFSLAYVFINLGSVTSTLLGPILRHNFKCFGQETCYSLAFAVPAVLMFISLVLFVFGKPLYVIKNPKSNILADALKCIFYALRKKVFSSSSGKKPAHWLGYAGDKFDPQLVKDVKEALSAVALILPVTIFAALACQQHSSWIFQMSRMDGVVEGWFTIQPEQLVLINPLCVIILIPLFEVTLYPMLAKIGIKRPLQLIVIGGFICASSFFMAAYVEYRLEPSYAKLPAPGLGQLRIFNGFPCQVQLDPPIDGRFAIPPLGALEWTDIPVKGNQSLVAKFKMNSEEPCKNIVAPKNWTREIRIFEEASTSYVISVLGGAADFYRVPGFDDVSKSETNAPRLRVIHNLDGPLSLKSEYKNEFTFQLHASDIVTSLNEVASGSYRVTCGNETILSGLQIKSGGVYTLVLQQVESSIIGSLHTITPPAALHILWEIPQKLTITVSEVFLFVMYFSFAFTQVPERMTSIMNSVLLASWSFGEILVVFITEMRFFKRQTYQFLFYAALMFLDVILIIFLSIRYKYKVVEKSMPLSDVSQPDDGGPTEDQHLRGESEDETKHQEAEQMREVGGGNHESEALTRSV